MEGVELEGPDAFHRQLERNVGPISRGLASLSVWKFKTLGIKVLNSGYYYHYYNILTIYFELICLLF